MDRSNFAVRGCRLFSVCCRSAAPFLAPPPMQLLRPFGQQRSCRSRAIGAGPALGNEAWTFQWILVISCVCLLRTLEIRIYAKSKLISVVFSFSPWNICVSSVPILGLVWPPCRLRIRAVRARGSRADRRESSFEHFSGVSDGIQESDCDNINNFVGTCYIQNVL